MKPRLSREHRTLENSQLTMNNEQRTTNKAMYYINRITTGEPVSTNALTPTHTHTPRRQRDGASAGSTRAFHEQRQPPESAENSEEGEIEEKSSRDSSAALRPRQNAIPSQSPFLSFYSLRREGRYNQSPHFILCPFGQGYFSISYLINTHYLGYSHQPTYTSNMYNHQNWCPRVRAGSHTLSTDSA